MKKSLLFIILSLGISNLYAGGLLKGNVEKKDDEKNKESIKKEDADVEENSKEPVPSNDPVAQLLQQKGIVKKLLVVIWDKLMKIEQKIDSLEAKLNKVA